MSGVTDQSRGCFGLEALTAGLALSATKTGRDYGCADAPASREGDDFIACLSYNHVPCLLETLCRYITS